MTLARTLFDNYWDLFDAPRGGWLPSVSVTETTKTFTVQMDLPGVAKEDVRLQCDRGVLSLSGERRALRLAEGETQLRSEATYGKFARHFTLPESVAAEGIEANMSEGVLTIRIPKAQRTTSQREIKIS